MSAAKALARAIRAGAARDAERRGPGRYTATVSRWVDENAFDLDLHGVDLQLNQDDVTLSQYLRAYSANSGIAVGDVLVLLEIEDGEFSAVAIESDTSIPPPEDVATQAELDAHAAMKTGTHGIPAMTSGHGLLWTGSAWVDADLATQAELDAHTALTTGAHGGIVASSDSRLSDTRTPTDNSVTSVKIMDGTIVDVDISATAAVAESKLNLATDAAAATGSRRTLGTGATQAAAGNDARLSDTRTPTDGTVTVAKTGTGDNGLARGSFAAYLGSNTAFATGAVVTFDTEEWDVSGWHDPATNKGRFTPLVAGYYRLAAVLFPTIVITTDKYVRADLYKNGGLYRLGSAEFQAGTGAGLGARGNWLAVANGSTDYFEVKIAHDNGGSLTLDGHSYSTVFQGELIGRA
jgi:hypothetical protein